MSPPSLCVSRAPPPYSIKTRKGNPGHVQQEATGQAKQVLRGLCEVLTVQPIWPLTQPGVHSDSYL